MELESGLFFFQISLGVVLSFPVVYWILTIFFWSERSYCEEEEEISSFTIILPMRNEVKFVAHKIMSIIEEVGGRPEVKIMVIDSDSKDGTRNAAIEALEDSNLARDRWDVISLERSGKSHAINSAMKRAESQVLIISDADAIISEGWFDKTIWWLTKKDVGAISGIEEIGNKRRGFESYYRRTADKLRIKESGIHSSPILEGSFLAFKKKCVGHFLLNETANADDTQIALRNIEMGYRTVMVSEITFSSRRNDAGDLKRSIRRSQGLSRALMRKYYLAYKSPSMMPRVAIFGAISTYVIFPWSLLLFFVNSISAISMEGPHILHWPYASLSLIIPLLSLAQGRSLLVGTWISLIAHIQFIFGKRYSAWDP